MPLYLAFLLSLVALAQPPGYARPPAHTLRRGLVGITSPRALVAVVAIAAAALVIAAVLRRIRRR